MSELSDSISSPQALTNHLSYPGGGLIIGAARVHRAAKRPAGRGTQKGDTKREHN